MLVMEERQQSVEPLRGWAVWPLWMGEHQACRAHRAPRAAAGLVLPAKACQAPELARAQELAQAAGPVPLQWAPKSASRVTGWAALPPSAPRTAAAPVLSRRRREHRQGPQQAEQGA